MKPLQRSFTDEQRQGGCGQCRCLCEALEAVTFAVFKIRSNLDIAAYSHDALATERIAAELFEAEQIRVKRRAELEQHSGEGSCGPLVTTLNAHRR